MHTESTHRPARPTFFTHASSSAPRVLGALVMMLASPAVLSAEAKQSLEQSRLGVIKGTTPGIVILDLGATQRAEPAASASVAMEAKPTEVVPQASWASKWLSRLPPPSGRSLNDARRLDAPDQGIPVPTAASASQPNQPTRATPPKANP